MPLYAVIGFDHPESITRREEIRVEHRAYVRDHMTPIRMAGAFNNEADQQIGTLYVFEAKDEEAVWRWLKAEPFYRDGIYRQLEVRRWNLVIGAIAPMEIPAS
jgi:uncharacterized protein YciI